MNSACSVTRGIIHRESIYRGTTYRSRRSRADPRRGRPARVAADRTGAPGGREVRPVSPDTRACRAWALCDPRRLMSSLLVCTSDGLVRLDQTDQTWRSFALLEGPVRCVAAARGRLIVGTRDGALLSTDEGESWRRMDLPEPDVYSVAVSAADGTMFAGMEPSRLFRSADGERWVELDALQSIPSRDTWRYPPRPWTSHVRWIAPDPHRPERLLVGIELGGRRERPRAPLLLGARGGPGRPRALVRLGRPRPAPCARRRTGEGRAVPLGGRRAMAADRGGTATAARRDAVRARLDFGWAVRRARGRD